MLGEKRIYGMFAFAVWEQNTGKLILARDRLGVILFIIRG